MAYGFNIPGLGKGTDTSGLYGATGQIKVTDKYPHCIFNTAVRLKDRNMIPLCRTYLFQYFHFVNIYYYCRDFASCHLFCSSVDRVIRIVDPLLITLTTEHQKITTKQLSFRECYTLTGRINDQHNPS